MALVWLDVNHHTDPGLFMRWSILNRRVHYWLSFLIALPLLVVIITGLLLQVKKDFPWVQPTENRGSAKVPTIGFDRILEICQGLPETEIQSWSDIARIDVRPNKGMLKVTANNLYEIQIDSSTGSVLQVAYRRSDVIEALHDGSFFHDAVKRWIFLPAGVILLVLWVTGMYLFILPRWVRWRKRAA